MSNILFPLRNTYTFDLHANHNIAEITSAFKQVMSDRASRVMDQHLDSKDLLLELDLDKLKTNTLRYGKYWQYIASDHESYSVKCSLVEKNCNTCIHVTLYTPSPIEYFASIGFLLVICLPVIIIGMNESWNPFMIALIVVSASIGVQWYTKTQARLNLQTASKYVRDELEEILDRV